MQRLVFHPRIEADVRDGMARYGEVSPALAERFKRNFYATLDAMVLFPQKQAVKFSPGIRTRLMQEFPYLIFHAVENDVIFVLTLQYAGRKPAYLRAVVRERRSV